MAESSEARVKHLEQVFLNGVTKSKGQSLSVETLLDALLVLYDECNSSALLREKNVSEFVDYGEYSYQVISIKSFNSSSEFDVNFTSCAHIS